MHVAPPSGARSGLPQTLKPPYPHLSLPVQVPQSIWPPHVSPFGPQLKPCWAHVFGAHVLATPPPESVVPNIWPEPSYVEASMPFGAVPPELPHDATVTMTRLSRVVPAKIENSRPASRVRIRALLPPV